jgi:hypothetical protein
MLNAVYLQHPFLVNYWMIRLTMKSFFLVCLYLLSLHGFAQKGMPETGPLAATAFKANALDTFNLVFSFPSTAFYGEYGAETDGEFVYVTQWHDDSLVKYDMSGNIIERFVIGGAGRIRDLAWDGQYFYGSPNANWFFILDLGNKELIATVQTTFKIRGMAYDPVEDVFWANEDWSPVFYKMDREGNILDTFTPAGASLGTISGLACDNYSPGGPFLWAFSQDSTGAMLVQYDIASKSQTNCLIDVSNLVSGPAYAGGLFISDLQGGTLPSIGGVIQSNLVFALKLDYINQTVGTATYPEPTQILVYPNPFTDSFMVNTGIQNNSHTTLRLINASGIVVHEEIMPKQSETRIHVPELPAGFYFVSLTGGSQTPYMQRILKIN